MFLLQFIQFTLLLRNILPEISVLDGQQLVQSLETLTKFCDQSKNYVRILDAVHHSLDLQVSQTLQVLTYQFSKISLHVEATKRAGAASVYAPKKCYSTINSINNFRTQCTL